MIIFDVNRMNQSLGIKDFDKKVARVMWDNFLASILMLD
jgi:hypothetical protein